MLSLRAVIFLLLSGLTFSKVSGQPYYFRHHQVEDGLSYNSVLCTIQDSRGFMWFGTRDGLNRFDGYQFKTFTHNSKDESSLGNNYVYSLAQDSRERIWVGTKNGLYWYDLKSGKFHLEPRTATKMINEIVIDVQGNIWFIASGRLFCINRKNGYQAMDLGNNEPLSSLAPGFKDELWLATESGLVIQYRIAAGSFRYYNAFSKTPEITARRIEKIWRGSNSQLYIGTSNHGVKLLDINTEKYRDILTFDDDHTEILARAFCRGEGNEVWIGTESGIYIYKAADGSVRNLKKNFYDPYSLSDNAIYGICRDREGGMWVGTYFGGINYFSSASTRFEKYFPKVTNESLKGNLIREFCMDSKGYLWVGTEDAGLNRLDLKKNTFLHVGFSGQPGSIAYNNVHGLLSVGDELWVGTYQHGLDVLNINTLKVIRHYGYGSGPNDLKSNFVNVLYKSNAGQIYLGTQVGLFRYNAKDDNFSFIAEAGSTYISCITEDHTGRIWVGTFGNGAYVLSENSKVWTRFEGNNGKNSLTSNVVTDIFEDSKHRLWFCTENGGLCRFIPGRSSFEKYSLPSDLGDKYLFNIIEDDRGQLWITSSGGLICLNPATRQLRLYSKPDGLLNDQFNYRSAFKDGEGRLYFGSSKGFIRHNILQQTNEPQAVPLYITGLQADHNGSDNTSAPFIDLADLLFADHVSLGRGNTSFSVDFAALSYTTPGTTSYRYKLEGFDKNWTTLSVNRRIYYTGVPSGDYVFKVQAMTGNEKSFSAARELKIFIAPVFLASLPAIIIYFVLFSLAVYLTWRWLNQRALMRNRRKMIFLEAQKERELYQAKIDFFTHVTHEIKTPLSLIKAPLEKVLEADHAGLFKKDLLLVNRNTDRLIDLVDQLLSFRKTEIDGYRLNFNRTNISALLADLCSSFQSAAQRAAIDFECIITSPVHAYVDQDAFHKILSNLLSNAIKYAATKVNVKLIATDDTRFSIVVNNDGPILPAHMAQKVFDPFIRAEVHKNKPGTGIGLSLVKALTDLHQGKIEYVNENDELNTFILMLPCHQPLELNIGTGQEREKLEGLADNDASNTDKPVILIVEDQQDIREFIYTLLDDTYHILLAENATLGKEILRDNDVQLVVSDVMMPGIDGFEFCRQLKNDINYSHLPIILLTAKDAFANKINGLDCGSDAYIEKPFSPKHLKLQIVNLLKNRDNVKEHFALSPIAPLKTIAHSTADAAFLQKLDTLIKESMSRPDFDIDHLAEEMNMSRPTLYRKVKAVTNLSPVELVTVTRLKQAAALLLQGDLKIYEIAEKVGFTSSAVLGRAFQKQFGVSPSMYAVNVKIH